MSVLKFSDGWKVDTDGPYRVIIGPDGLYVTGHGFLCAVDTLEEGNEMINDLEGVKDASWAGKQVKDMEP